jgi:TAG lipase/lysophosphatidylethanolamine acyltransferase
VRNLGNITTPRLFSHAHAGTKLLIEDYVAHVALAVRAVAEHPTSAPDAVLTNQAKLDVLHDTRQAFGRSALVLQGGSVFGLCHFGVVKALHLAGLLPRIVAGTATGALIAAFVGVHTDDELLAALSADGIDLTAFQKGRRGDGTFNWEGPTWLSTIKRRLGRLLREGSLLDASVLEECVRANVGDLTFEEAYLKTKRVLNITVSTASTGVPAVLNYLTAPNVLIWSAALASNASSALYSPVQLQCKDEHGTITPWPHAHDATFRPWRSARAAPAGAESPLARVAELFNVNHFIVSQARPYLAPFVRSDAHHADPRQERAWRATSLACVRVLRMEVQHRLAQLDGLGLLPAAARRFLLDESMPGAALLVVPEIAPRDFWRLLENPTRESVGHWIRRGEQSVWPAVAAIRVRCAIEVELDRGYQVVRRRKPFDVTTPGRAGRREAPVVRKRAQTASSGSAAN